MSATKTTDEEMDDDKFALLVAVKLDDAEPIDWENNKGSTHRSDNITSARMYADKLRRQFEAILCYEAEEMRLAEELSAAAFARPAKAVCVSCDDSYPPGEMWRAPCAHDYCIGCLERLHCAALTDESLYPPTCCRHEMPWNDVKSRIDDALAVEFGEIKETLDQQVGQRAYCSDPTCSKSTETEYIANEVATCDACSKVCETSLHDGDCSWDAAL